MAMAKLSSMIGKLFSILWKIFKCLFRLGMYFIFFYVVYHNFNKWVLHEDYDYTKFTLEFMGAHGRIYIPKDIVKSRDCDRLYKWQHQKIPRELWGLCPWAEVRDHRKVGMADLWFDFPRKYLGVAFEPSNLKDGPVYGLFAEWDYPDMTRSNDSTYSKNISIFMEDTKRVEAIYENQLVYYYMQFLHLNKFSNNYKIVFLNYDENMRLNKYRVDEYSTGLGGKPHTFHTYLYTNDNPQHPSYFVVCDTENSTRCSSVFLYKDLISVKYTMPRELLPHHGGIKNQILNFMRQYEIPSPY
jgi:hypothetical protein